MSKHRPIYVLLSTNKIFESLINCRLKKILDRHNILCKKQFGFRVGKSTELAALKLVEGVLSLLQVTKICICVYLDFSACFDTLSSDILFNTLHGYE